jgi:hypothetical protein
MLMHAKSLDYEKIVVGPSAIGCVIMASNHNNYCCHATLTLDWQYEIPNTGLGPFSLHSLVTSSLRQRTYNLVHFMYFHLLNLKE